MKITTSDGVVFEGTLSEYEEFIAYIERKEKDTDKYVPTRASDNETIEFEGAQYRKVDREAREGDVVIITHNNGLLPSWYTLGRKYKVVEGGQIFDNDGDVQDVYSKDFGRTRKTIDVYEPVIYAEEAKWAKIGRKVNEYKKGDIARVVEYNHGHDVGTIVEVIDIDSDGDIEAKANGKQYFYHPERLELIAPVESLFQH